MKRRQGSRSQHRAHRPLEHPLRPSGLHAAPPPTKAFHGPPTAQSTGSKAATPSVSPPCALHVSGPARSLVGSECVIETHCEATWSLGHPSTGVNLQPDLDPQVTRARALPKHLSFRQLTTSVWPGQASRRSPAPTCPGPAHDVGHTGRQSLVVSERAARRRWSPHFLLGWSRTGHRAGPESREAQTSLPASAAKLTSNKINI